MKEVASACALGIFSVGAACVLAISLMEYFDSKKDKGLKDDDYEDKPLPESPKLPQNDDKYANMHQHLCESSKKGKQCSKGNQYWMSTIDRSESSQGSWGYFVDDNEDLSLEMK